MNSKVHSLSVYALVTGIIYLLWLATAVHNPVGLLYFFLELGLFLLLVLFVINHWSRRYVLSGGSYSLRAITDIIIPTKGEPARMLERTVKAARAISNPNIRIYIVDDANKKSIKRIAKKYSCDYLVRPNRKTKAYKAAALNYAFKHSYGNFILVLDADHRVKASILDDLLGHFKYPKIAFVATRQGFEVNAKDFNHDHLFYEYMQPGKNTEGAAISCGSGVIYRRSAIAKIGGFSEWNIVEDLHTSYVLNCHGLKGLYISQPYTIGEAPTDLKVIYKQRGIWAIDSLRLILWQMPLFNRALTVAQRLHYMEMGYIYLVGGLILPAVFFLNFYALIFNVTIVTAGLWYIVFKLPSFYFTLKLYDELGQGSSSSRMWAALFPLYLRSIFLALFYKKPAYTVTKKANTSSPKRRVNLVFPQMFTIGCGVVSLIYHLVTFQVTQLLVVNFFWFGVMIYWLWPVFPKAFALTSSQVSAILSRYMIIGVFFLVGLFVGFTTVGSLKEAFATEISPATTISFVEDYTSLFCPEGKLFTPSSSSFSLTSICTADRFVLGDQFTLYAKENTYCRR